MQLRLKAGKVGTVIRHVAEQQRYPKQSPLIKLHRPVRLTAGHVRGLLQELQDVCRKNMGEDMIVLVSAFTS